MKKKYPNIAKKHPKIDFELLDKVINFVKNHPKNILGISVKDISNGLNVRSPKVRIYCLKYAVPFQELIIHKKGNSYKYPVLISPFGEFKSVKNFDLALEESCSLIIDFFNQNPNRLPVDMKKDLNNLKVSLMTGKPSIGAQEKLITVLWEYNVDINCATFRRTNYLFC